MDSGPDPAPGSVEIDRGIAAVKQSDASHVPDSANNIGSRDGFGKGFFAHCFP